MLKDVRINYMCSASTSNSNFSSFFWKTNLDIEFEWTQHNAELGEGYMWVVSDDQVLVNGEEDKLFGYRPNGIL